MKAQRLDLDRISTLPPPIIEDIICRIYPIQEAARTCILSREWRYKWANVPKLKFNENMFEVSTDENQPSIPKRFKFFHAIYQVLLLHQGPIHEFSLIMDAVYADNNCIEIDHIIITLSRNNALKNLTLKFSGLGTGVYRLPLSIFSLHQLTYLCLVRCQLDHQPIFNGFHNLTTLYLRLLTISAKTLRHLLSSCPLLRRLFLFVDECGITNDDNSTISDLLQCLPVIKHLSILFWIIRSITEDGIPKMLPTTLVHLKFFYIEDLYFIDEYALPFVVFVLRSSPNLEKLRLKIYHDPPLETLQMQLFTLEDYSDIWLEHLNELKIGDFVYLKHSMELVKLILAKSPVLKNVTIYLSDEVTKDEEMLILRTLLRSPRASPVVEIIVAGHCDSGDGNESIYHTYFGRNSC